MKPTLNLLDWRGYCKSPSYNPDHDHFRIESMKNTIDYIAGQFIAKTTVEDLINIGWNINIRQPKESDF